ncbi:hypothetical protein BDV12DRAFT_163339 [Aspergillus spectabilis]
MDRLNQKAAKPTCWNEPTPNIARDKGIWLAAAANRGKYDALHAVCTTVRLLSWWANFIRLWIFSFHLMYQY